jgi:hypothetical protein
VSELELFTCKKIQILNVSFSILFLVLKNDATIADKWLACSVVILLRSL